MALNATLQGYLPQQYGFVSEKVTFLLVFLFLQNNLKLRKCPQTETISYDKKPSTSVTRIPCVGNSSVASPRLLPPGRPSHLHHGRPIMSKSFPRAHARMFCQTGRQQWAKTNRPGEPETSESCSLFQRKLQNSVRLV